MLTFINLFISNEDILFASLIPLAKTVSAMVLTTNSQLLLYSVKVRPTSSFFTFGKKKKSDGLSDATNMVILAHLL